MTAIYSLHHVEKDFGDRRALSVAQLELAEGGVTALVGPNGAGKTTLLRLLAFLDAPTRGELLFRGVGTPPIAGESRGSLHSHRPRHPIAFVDQTPLLFRGTVESNVSYGPRALGLPRGQTLDRVSRQLEDLGLERLAGRRAQRLSGGETRRVALARALAIDPEVLLLDEPFAEVDRESVDRTERLLQARGRTSTVIFTTHDLAQAYRLAERVISMVDGRVSPAALVNLFRGSVVVRGGVPIFCAKGIEFEVTEAGTRFTLATVDPEAIVVSLEPLQSSARNSFRGRVVRVESEDGSLRLTVDCGVSLIAAVTRHSYQELGLNAGSPVWITFKSTAVHLY